MSTIKQCLLKKRKLLLAAVILFGLIFASLYLNRGETTTEKNLSEIPCVLESPSTGDTYLSANTLASLSVQEQNLNEEGASFATLHESVFLVQNSPVTFISQEPRTGIIDYTVQEGDTISSIAASFGISVNTLLWANELKEISIIRPGDVLTVPPITGVICRVKDNQTIGWIANYYDADAKEIIAFNGLNADGNIQIGERLVVPDGRMPTPVAPKITYVAPKSYVTGAGTGKSHNFPYGQCTWYVAQKIIVPWAGHAKSWLSNARAYGRQTGTTARVGSIITTNESWYGHVGYVEAVNGSWVTFSEMNHAGWGIKSVRTLRVDDWRIKGYIYF
ncbi:LysM peptidoglycan-binding domain-containing protein [Patescibacteria group bacterium]|nr:LysM peptidoglycan-binding domain-containing protein [Patescibacteria group bacterium]MBU2579711.1 LysM peptidoglycan-binding domain-containing protein [Patescibacteria group bacterium]